MISITRFETLNPGPHLIVLGAVHGNETCGTTAIRKLIDKLNNGAVKLVNRVEFSRANFSPDIIKGWER